MKRRVKITWHDAQTLEEGWVHVEDVEPTNDLVFSLGWLIYEDDDHYIISHSYDPDIGLCCGLIQIPTVWVEEFEYID